MKRILFYSVIFLNLSSVAQNKAIYGTVKNVETKQPVSFCGVGITGTTIGTRYK